MERCLIKNIQIDKQNLLYGFVENIRNKKTMAFIVLRDVTGKIQVTVEKGKNEQLDNIVDQITLESVISVKGKALKNEYVKLGGIEVLAEEI